MALMRAVPRQPTDEITAMMNGSVDVAIDSMTTLYTQAQAGAVRALAVTSEHRLASAPDLPTIGETLPGFAVEGWQQVCLQPGRHVRGRSSTGSRRW